MAYIGSPAAPTIATVSDDTITSAKLADDAVTSAKITDGAVTPSDLSTGHPNWDSSGNVGIGTTNPSGLGGATVNTVTNGSTSYQYVGAVNGTKTFIAYGDASQNIMGSVTNIPLIFRTSNTERMRIDTNGNLLVGTTNTNNNTEDGLRLYGGAKYASFTRNGGSPLALVRRSNGGEILEFFYNSTKVGTVSISTTNTSYNTSSDYRLKENVVEVTDGISRVKLLKPSRFNFIVDPDKTVDGFLAHEVADVVPEAITGTKDAMRTEDVYDEDGNVTGTQEVPDYQGIDQSKLVPLLTAALQEAITKIETLEARVATLESA